MGQRGEGCGEDDAAEELRVVSMIMIFDVFFFLFFFFLPFYALLDGMGLGF